MKAALLTEINKPLVITDVEPCVLQPGQVLVRVLVSGICGAQLQEIRGEKGTHFPRLLGHEGCGIVEYAGPGVTKVKPGQKVIMHWRKGSGMESEAPRYTYGETEITSGQVTTFSEYSVCSENRLTVVPDDVPNDLCALLGCGLSTALGVMENEAQLKMGESVLIVGCGGVGLNLIRVAKMMGASVIVGRDTRESKRMAAHVAGCSDYWNGGTELFSDICRTNKLKNFDVIIDTVGHSLTFEVAVELLAPSGRYILVGQPAPNSSIVIPNARHLFDGEGKTIKATQGGQFNPDKDIARYIAAWRSGHLKIDGIITHRFPFEKINDALDVVRNGQGGRVLLEMV